MRAFTIWQYGCLLAINPSPNGLFNYHNDKFRSLDRMMDVETIELKLIINSVNQYRIIKCQPDSGYNKYKIT